MPADTLTRAYFDTSVFVKSYVIEPGTSDAVRLIQDTLDAIHLATALTFEADADIRFTFITGDVQQRRAGLALGLRVIFVE